MYGQAASHLVAGTNLEGAIQQILDMGGGMWDRDTVIRALRAAFNNPERAVEYLYSVSTPESSFTYFIHYLILKNTNILFNIYIYYVIVRVSLSKLKLHQQPPPHQCKGRQLSSPKPHNRQLSFQVVQMQILWTSFLRYAN